MTIDLTLNGIVVHGHKMASSPCKNKEVPHKMKVLKSLPQRIKNSSLCIRFVILKAVCKVSDLYFKLVIFLVSKRYFQSENGLGGLVLS